MEMTRLLEHARRLDNVIQSVSQSTLRLYSSGIVVYTV